MRTWILVLSSGIFAVGAVDAAGDKDRSNVSIVTRAIDFHGGERYAASETEMSMCSKSGCSLLRVRQDRGSFEIEVEGPAQDGNRRVLMTNATVRAWRDGTEAAIDSDKQKQKLRDWAMARVYFCFLPYRLGDPSVILEDRGLVSWNGRSLHQVKVTFESGTSTDDDDEYVYWFDPETARLELFAYSYDGGLRFRRTFDHRRVGGLLFFDQQNFGIDEDGVSVEVIDERFVAERMRHVSTVELRDIRVRALGGIDE